MTDEEIMSEAQAENDRITTEKDEKKEIEDNKSKIINNKNIRISEISKKIAENLMEKEEEYKNIKIAESQLAQERKNKILLNIQKYRAEQENIDTKKIEKTIETSTMIIDELLQEISNRKQLIEYTNAMINSLIEKQNSLKKFKNTSFANISASLKHTKRTWNTNEELEAVITDFEKIKEEKLESRLTERKKEKTSGLPTKKNISREEKILQVKEKMDQRQFLQDREENTKERREAKQVITSEIENREKVLKELIDADKKYEMKKEEDNQKRIEKEQKEKDMVKKQEEELENRTKQKEKELEAKRINLEEERKPINYENDLIQFKAPIKIHNFLSQAEKLHIRINRSGGKGSHYKLETKDPVTSKTLVDTLPVHSKGAVISVPILKKISKNLQWTQNILDSLGGTVIRSENK